MSTVPTCAASANPLAALPASACNYLRRLIARMNRTNERIHATAFAVGSYSAELLAKKEAAGLDKCRIELRDFRAIARRNGFDGAACVEAAALEYGLGEFASFRAIVSTSPKGGHWNA